MNPRSLAALAAAVLLVLAGPLAAADEEPPRAQPTTAKPSTAAAAAPIQEKSAAPKASTATAKTSDSAKAKALKEREGPYDWCSSIVVRPDRRMQGGTACTPVWSQEEVAAGADVVLYGSFRDISYRDGPTTTERCGGPVTHERNGKYAAQVRALRAAGPQSEKPLRFLRAARFDLVSAERATLKGFKASFLVESATPVSATRDFFRKDKAGACAEEGGCRWDPGRWDRSRRRKGEWLTQQIDRSEKNRSKRVVYYLPRHLPRATRFGPAAAIADLGNPEYRKWRIDMAKKSMEIASYDALILSNKFSQYAEPGFWLGSDRYPNVASVVRSRDSVWSSAPVDYGYPEYVAGYRAMAQDLAAAGIPYAVRLSPHPWLTRWDDPATPDVDERELLLETVRGARFILLDVANLGGVPLATWKQRLAKNGAEVIAHNSSCGTGRGELW